ncbi:MAG TPA: S41 family peptidase [Povalibacter sp.]|nr:S41 family peptidase [Povalibacter sp.]
MPDTASVVIDALQPDNAPMSMRAVHSLLMTLGVLVSQLAAAAPRDVAERAATLIENNFYDAARARDIAGGIEAAARAGQFDGLHDPRDLAAALTTRLRSFDRHFNVIWSGNATVANQVAALPGEVMDRRGNYGFRRVEMLPGAIALIDMRMFADFRFDQPDEPARKAADAALAFISGADAVIVDLRSNGGGSPAMVGYLVSAFTPADAAIYNEFHRRDAQYSERPGEPYAKPMLDVPLFVLISGRTASAAESAAYTLQAAHRATVVGEVSAGAANPGGLFPIGEGFNIFISTGTPINAVTGGNWEGVGVKPDVAIVADRAPLRAQILALEAVLARRPDRPESRENQWILEALRVQEGGPGKGPSLQEYVGDYSGAKIVMQGSALLFFRGERPPVQLTRIRGDTFFVSDEPFRRVLFERARSGKVSGLQLVRNGSDTLWFRR